MPHRWRAFRKLNERRRARLLRDRRRDIALLPVLQPLESRRLLSSFVVTSINDAGAVHDLAGKLLRVRR